MNEFLREVDRLVQRQRTLGLAEENLKARCRHWRMFTAWLVNVRHRQRFDEVTVEDITQWKAHVLLLRTRKGGLPLRPRTMHCIHCAIRTLCAWLVQEGILAPSVARSYALPRIGRTYIAAPRHAQVRRALRAISTADSVGHLLRAMGETLYSTGARPSEVLRIDIGDVDSENGLVRLIGKARKERVVPIGEQAIRWIQSYRHGVRPTFLRDPAEKALFLGFYGGRLTYQVFRRWWSRLARRLPALAGLTAYSLRRACATELVRSGASLSAVQDQLGHEDARNLIHYVRTDLADLKKALARYHPRDREMSDETKF